MQILLDSFVYQIIKSLELVLFTNLIDILGVVLDNENVFNAFV